MNVLTIRLEPHRAIGWNSLYTQGHWSKRADAARLIHTLVREQIDPNWPVVDKPVHIQILATMKNRPLDPDNVCAKLYIDGLVGHVLKDDNYQNVLSVTTASRLGKVDSLLMTVKLGD